MDGGAEEGKLLCTKSAFVQTHEVHAAPIHDLTYALVHRAAFKPFVDEGYVKFVYGGAEEGKLLCNSPVVKSIHLTGSAATYEAIMWGTGSRKVSLYNTTFKELVRFWT